MVTKSIGLVVGFALATLSCVNAYGGFAKYVDCTVNANYTGNAVANFPVLVKIDGTKIPGFYSEVKNAGADLKFTDSVGGVEYPYEVDTWNASGTSLVWVKLPSFAKDIAFRMYYGDASKTTNPNVRDVWSGYVAVVHFNGVNGINDSAAGYEGLRIGDDATGGLESTGPVGGGYCISDAGIDDQGGGVVLKGSEVANLKTGCTITMWMKHKSGQNCNGAREKLLYKRDGAFSPKNGQFAYTTRNQATPWDVFYYSSAANTCWGTNMGNGQNLATDTWKHIATSVDFSTGDWKQLCNGVQKNSGNHVLKKEIVDNAYPIAIGNSASTSYDVADTSYKSWKGSFDEVRVYDGALSSDWIAAEYSVATADVITFGEPKTPSDALIGSFSADVLSGNLPEVTFTANVVGGSGTKYYEWDFEGVDKFVSSGTDPFAVHQYAKRGLFSVVMKVTAGSETIYVTNANYIASSSPIYVDSDAAAGGDGTEEKPMNNLADAFAEVAYASAYYLRGTFTMDTVGYDISKNGLTISKWGDAEAPKPVITRSDAGEAPLTGIFKVSANDVVFSDLSFSYPSSIHIGGALIYPKGARIVIRRCDFALTSAPAKVSYKGVIGNGDDKVGDDLLIEGCTFDGYTYTSASVYRVLFVRGGTTVRSCKFNNCSNILYLDTNKNPWDLGPVSFVSNIVVNSTATSKSGSHAGAVATCDAWSFCQGLTIAHNILINNNSVNAGCVATIRGGNNPYANGPLAVYNNTIIGYDAVVETDSLTCESANAKTVFKIFNNLCNGAIPMYVDSQDAWHIKENASFVRNNVSTGGDVYTVPNYTLTDHATVADNKNDATIVFKTLDPCSPDFCRVKTVKGGWIFQSYTDGGKYPSYIGAVSPIVIGGMSVLIR